MTENVTRIETLEDAMTAFQVTREQLAKCQAVQELGKWFYIVASQSQPGVEYCVAYNRDLKALQCLPFNGGPVCKASAAGFGCWHKRAAKALHVLWRAELRKARERDQARAESERSPQEIEEQSLIARLVGQGWPLEMATRVATAKGPQFSERKIRAAMRENEMRARPFRLLK